MHRREDGDEYLSPQDRHLWGLIYSTALKFKCLTIFRKHGPWGPDRKDCWIYFFVPRCHPNAQEVKQYLEHEAKSLIRVGLQLEDDWLPGTHVKVHYYSGADPYLERDDAEEIAEMMCESFIASIRKELS